MKTYPLLTWALAAACCLHGQTTDTASRGGRTRGGATEMPAQGELAGLLAPKVPETGQEGMKWQGLDLLEQVENLARGMGDVQTPGWRPMTAPGSKASPPADARMEYYLTEGWTFTPVSVVSGQLGNSRPAQAPERWHRERDYCAGWYTTRVALSPAEGERLVMRFDQVALFGVLYVNGVECGRHLGGFTPFKVDITRAVRKGENSFALYVHDLSGAAGKGKFYNMMVVPQGNEPYMGGLWGAVALERHPALYVNDLFVKTSTRRQELTLECELGNAGPERESAKLSFEIFKWPDGEPVSLAIPSQEILLEPARTNKVVVTMPWSNPRLWSPDHPNLYVVRARLKSSSASTGGADVLDNRFGFREFWAEGQQFMLNGVPTRLRGESYWGPGRQAESADPFKGRDYNRRAFLELKELYRASAYRVHAQIVPGNVVLGGDEAGCLLIDQSSIWSLGETRYRNGGEPFLANTRREFGEWIRRDRNSPSVAIWDVENEQIRMQMVNKPWTMRLDAFVRENDDTRLIEHSGAGWYDKNLQIVHLHDEEQFVDIMERWKAQDNHPLVMGEFWVGFHMQFRLTSAKEYRSRADYTLEEARLDEEELLQMRNFGISGIMPFQISRVMGRFGSDVEARLQAIHHGLQPVTAFFWPRVVSAAAGEEVSRELVVCNDSETARELVAEWTVEGALPQKSQVKLLPGEQRRLPVSFVAPAKDFRLTTRLLEGDEVEASEEILMRVADAQLLSAPTLKRQLIVYEGSRPGTVEKLKSLGITARAASEVPDQPEQTLWIIGSGASDAALNAQAGKIRSYLEEGGRILCLPQEKEPGWSPVPVKLSPALHSSPAYYVTFGVPLASKETFYSCYAPIYAAGHPIFAGINASELRHWSPRDNRVADDTLIRPAASGESVHCGWRALAGACLPELLSMAEARVGRGTLVFCQVQALEQSQTAEARLVLMNLLRYLDGPGWAPGSGHLALAGALSATNACALTGAALGTFAGAEPTGGDVLVATDGAAVTDLEQWANAGGTVLVLSGEVAGRLPGYAVSRDEGQIYSGACGQGHPLLWGVCSESFMGFDHPCVEGVLRQTPPAARILLHGLSTRPSSGRRGANRTGNQRWDMFDAAGGPVAVAQVHGKGTWIVTTMAPWRGQDVHSTELMRTLLANAGAVLDSTAHEARLVKVLKTVPLKMEGRLDEWTSDMEDRNVSPYVHAKPIVISSQDAVSGAARGDSDLSAIVYFLWNEQGLYMGGALFGRSENAVLTARINGHRLSLAFSGGTIAPSLDGQTLGTVRAVSGMVSSDTLTDAHALSLGGVANGVSFESAFPWQTLGFARPPARMDSLIQVGRADGLVLQPFASGSAQAQNGGLSLVLTD